MYIVHYTLYIVDLPSYCSFIVPFNKYRDGGGKRTVCGAGIEWRGGRGGSRNSLTGGGGSGPEFFEGGV